MKRELDTDFRGRLRNLYDVYLSSSALHRTDSLSLPDHVFVISKTVRIVSSHEPDGIAKDASKDGERVLAQSSLREACLYGWFFGASRGLRGIARCRLRPVQGKEDQVRLPSTMNDRPLLRSTRISARLDQVSTKVSPLSRW